MADSLPIPVVVAAKVEVPPPLSTEMPAPVLIKVDPTSEATRRKVVNSGWIMTVSPNMRYEMGSEDARKAMRRLQKAIDATFGATGENMGKYVVWMTEGNKPEPHLVCEPPGYLACVEQGQVNSIVHGHILYQVVHRSKIQLNYQQMRADLAKNFGLATSELYCFTHLVRSKHTNLSEYITKQRAVIDKADFKNGLVPMTIAAEASGMQPSSSKFSKAQPAQVMHADPPPKPKKKNPAVITPALPFKAQKGLPPPITTPKREKYRDQSESEESESEGGSTSGSAHGSTVDSDSEEARPQKSKHAVVEKSQYGWAWA